MRKKIDISLILPVHNQAKIIEPVFKKILSKVKRMHVSFEILLVENGSRDNTYSVLKRIAKQYPRTKALTAKKGYGSAIIKGMNIAQGDYITYMPSDGQADASLLPQLWELIRTTQFDMVKVKRTSRETALRLLLSEVFSLSIAFLFNTKKTDVNGSPRVFKRESLKDLQLSSRDSFIDAELLIKASNLGWRIKEIPMRHIERVGGKSSRNYKTYLEFIRNILDYRFSSKLSSWRKKSGNL